LQEGEEEEIGISSYIHTYVITFLPAADDDETLALFPLPELQIRRRSVRVIKEKRRRFTDYQSFLQHPLFVLNRDGKADFEMFSLRFLPLIIFSRQMAPTFFTPPLTLLGES